MASEIDHWLDTSLNVGGSESLLGDVALTTQYAVLCDVNDACPSITIDTFFRHSENHDLQYTYLVGKYYNDIDQGKHDTLLNITVGVPAPLHLPLCTKTTGNLSVASVNVDLFKIRLAEYGIICRDGNDDDSNLGADSLIYEYHYQNGDTWTPAEQHDVLDILLKFRSHMHCPSATATSRNVIPTLPGNASNLPPAENTDSDTANPASVAVDDDTQQTVNHVDAAAIEVQDQLDAGLPPQPVERTVSAVSELCCCICLDVMIDPVSLLCGHSGCKTCMLTALTRRSICPICRANIPSSHPLNVTVALRSAIHRLFAADADYQTRLRAQLSPPREEDTVTASGPPAALQLVPVIPTQVSLRLHALGAEYWNRLRHCMSRPTPDSALFRLAAEQQSLDQWAPHSGGTYTMELVAPDTPNIHTVEVSIASIRRLLRRAGVLTEEALVYDEIRSLIAGFMKEHVRSVIAVDPASTNEENLLMVRADNVLSSLRRVNISVYGCGGVGGIRFIWSPYIPLVLLQVQPIVMLEPRSLSILNDILTECLHTIVKSAMDNAMQASSLQCEDSTFKKGVIVDFIAPEGVPQKRLRMCLPGDDDNSTDALVRPVLTTAMVEDAVRSVWHGELINMARREGRQAVTKFKERSLTADITDAIRLGSGLLFDPLVVGSVLNHWFQVVPTSHGMVYLTAVIEYLCAEILELSGNACRDNMKAVILPRHICLAIRSDHELLRTCPGVVREGGVMANVHSYFLSGNGVDNSTFESDAWREFDRLLHRLAEVYPGPFVNPLTGKHIVKSEVFGILKVPDLDAACTHTTQERAALAMHLLNASDKRIVANVLASTARILPQNLIDIRAEQREMRLCIDTGVFACLVYKQTIAERGNILWTAEALEALQIATESYLLQLVESAVAASRNSLRRILKRNDIRLATRYFVHR